MGQRLKKKPNMIMGKNKIMTKIQNHFFLMKKMQKMMINNMQTHSPIKRQDLENYHTRISLEEKSHGMIPLSLTDLKLYSLMEKSIKVMNFGPTWKDKSFIGEEHLIILLICNVKLWFLMVLIQQILFKVR